MWREASAAPRGHCTPRDGLEAFVEPTAVGTALIEMPLFLTLEVYVPVPLEATYQSAWEGMPAFWRGVVETSPSVPS